MATEHLTRAELGRALGLEAGDVPLPVIARSLTRSEVRARDGRTILWLVVGYVLIALAILAEPKGVRGSRAAATPTREIGAHPADGKPVQLFDGKYGPYVKHGELNASLPKGTDPATFSLEAAVELIADRGKAPKGKGRAKTTARRRTAKA